MDSATSAQEERSLVAFQNLTLASPPIYPTQSSDFEMVGSEVKEPTSVQVPLAPSLSDELSTLDNNSSLDKLRTDINDIKQALKGFIMPPLC